MAFSVLTTGQLSLLFRLVTFSCELSGVHVCPAVRIWNVPRVRRLKGTCRECFEKPPCNVSEVAKVLGWALSFLPVQQPSAQDTASFFQYSFYFRDTRGIWLGRVFTELRLSLQHPPIRRGCLEPVRKCYKPNMDLEESKVQGFLAKQEMMATAQAHADSCRVRLPRAPWLGWTGLPRPRASLWEPVPGSGSHYKSAVRGPRALPTARADCARGLLKLSFLKIQGSDFLTIISLLKCDLFESLLLVYSLLNRFNKSS